MFIHNPVLISSSADGSLHGCGYNFEGGLGVGDTEKHVSLVLIPNLPKDINMTICSKYGNHNQVITGKQFHWYCVLLFNQFKNWLIIYDQVI